MFKLKNVVVFLVILLLIAGITLQVKATDSSINLSNLLTSSNTTSTNTTSINTVGTSNTISTLDSSNTVNTANTVGGSSIIQPEEENDTEDSSENDLPQTGVTEDITVMFFIVVCGISAIYAYKKIRDYNV